MAIYAENAGTSIPKLEDGPYYARCQAMVEIGTVIQQYQDQKPKPAKKVRLVWEVCGETYEDNEGNVKQRTVAKEFTLSMHEKASLRKFLEAWRTKKFTEDQAKKFDITVLIGQPCIITLIANEKGYPDIQSVSAPMKGATVPELVNPAYELSYEKWDKNLYAAQPEFVRNAMAKTPEYCKLFNLPYSPDTPAAPARTTAPPPAQAQALPQSQQRMLNQKSAAAPAQPAAAPAGRPPQLGVDKKQPVTPNVKEKYTAEDDAKDLPLTETEEVDNLPF